ncbi:site-specific DNA-methyltransferase [Candidatus Woesearchaeota archaeon]|nr:site-specific DNA-methyltransferase [Candidatus Woesearchaeota archaeon]
MAKKDYANWSKTELVKELDKLSKRKKYGIVWEDKPEQVAELCKEKLPILEEDKKKEIKTDVKKPTNILIEGDNYHALSVLNYTHKGAIDVIYIDPPYNTGNEGFVYNDRVVDKNDSYRHSKWLSFMAKRLKLARPLLKQNGIIFISIDNNEQSQLKLLCDEIFDEKNFIGQIIIQSNPRGSQASRHLADVHEYVLVYAKSSSSLVIKGFSKEETAHIDYPYKDKFGKRYRFLGLRQRGGEWKREQRPNMYYPIYVNPKDNSVSLQKTKMHYIETFPKRPSGEEGRWTWSQKKAQENISLLIGKKVNRKGEDEFYDIFRINYYEDEEGNGTLTKPKTIWIDKELNYQNGRAEVKELFDGKDVFDYPKPTYLIKKLIEIAGKKRGIVLDFFAGSGTTGHAVLTLNLEDNGERHFILCTDNQDNNGTGLKIATDICYPRVKKAIENLEKESKGKLISDRPSGLKYFKTDFVDAEPTDKNKKKLVDKSTEMLCLKEDCFDEIKREGDYRLFKNSQDTYLGIIYSDDGIEPFKKEIKKMKKKFITYVFSLDESAREEEFEDVTNLVELRPIPAVILNVYKRIFK